MSINLITDRYNVKNTLQALETLGFNVREPSGASTIFCVHKITCEEIWIPKKNEGFLQDFLQVIFDPIKLRFEYFKFIYYN